MLYPMIKQRRRRRHYTGSPKVRQAGCYWKVKWSKRQYGIGHITYEYKCPEHNPAIPLTRHLARSLKRFIKCQHFEALNFSFSFFSFPFFIFIFIFEGNTLCFVPFRFHQNFFEFLIFLKYKIFVSLLLAARE